MLVNTWGVVNEWGLGLTFDLVVAETEVFGLAINSYPDISVPLLTGETLVRDWYIHNKGASTPIQYEGVYTFDVKQYTTSYNHGG